MARAISSDEADELNELWARLERLKVGIGGWVITAAAMAPADARAADADDKIRELVATALEVRARIGELTSPRPVVPVPASPPPLSPVNGIPVIDMPDVGHDADMLIEPGSELWGALEPRTRRRLLREHAAHRTDDTRRDDQR